MKIPVLLLCAILANQASAQSAASRASSTALELSAEAGSLALRDGSRFVVTALRPVGASVEISVQTAGSGASAVLRLGAATVEAAGLASGTMLVATSVGAGWILRAGSEAVMFVPNEIARSHLHHRRL